MSLLLIRRRRLSNIQIQKTGAGMAHQALSLRPLLIWSVSTILLLKLTRLFGPKVKESLFTRNT